MTTYQEQSVKIYNSLSGKKEHFKLKEGDRLAQGIARENLTVLDAKLAAH